MSRAAKICEKNSSSGLVTRTQFVTLFSFHSCLRVFVNIDV